MGRMEGIHVSPSLFPLRPLQLLDPLKQFFSSPPSVASSHIDGWRPVTYLHPVTDRPRCDSQIFGNFLRFQEDGQLLSRVPLLFNCYCQAVSFLLTLGDI